MISDYHTETQHLNWFQPLLCGAFSRSDILIVDRRKSAYWRRHSDTSRPTYTLQWKKTKKAYYILIHLGLFCAWIWQKYFSWIPNTWIYRLCICSEIKNKENNVCVRIDCLRSTVKACNKEAGLNFYGKLYQNSNS